MSIPVTVDNFPRAESDTMIARMLPIIGDLGVFHHDRQLPPFDQQPIIRQNRDTLYSAAIVDLGNGPATVTVPEAGDRYVSVMAVNQDHYVMHVFHEAGDHVLRREDLGTDYVVLAARILFDPNDPGDLARVNALQDGLRLRVSEQRPFELPEYDAASHTEVREALLTLARHSDGFAHAFGRPEEVEAVPHLISTAAGWGGLPDSEAAYLGVAPDLPVGAYRMRFRDVPADAFWSLSVYNAAGYFEPGPSGVTNVNSVFAAKDDDGSTTVLLGGDDDDTPGRIPLPGEGWNLLVRLYRPRRDELATWTLPPIERI